MDTACTAADKTLFGFQDRLLTIAFDTAAMIPIKPHIKDRAKTQEAVVAAALELEQPARALKYIRKIENWRQGAAYADLAFYCARHGHGDEIQPYVDFAARIAEVEEDWRRDTIRVNIAKAYTWLGKTEDAASFEADVVDSQSGRVAGVKAMTAADDSFEAQVKALNELIATDNFDIIRNALSSYTELYNRFYDDKKKRRHVESNIKNSWRQMPVFIRIGLLSDLANFSLEHGDKRTAFKFVNEIQSMLDAHEWPPEHGIKIRAKLAGLRARAGDAVRARKDADALRTLFEKEKDLIVNIYRGGVLRPLAESYQAMGDTADALVVYKMAIEEGVENPNSRPRAEDLSATCVSMALHRVEPDEALWSRIFEIKDQLSDPW